PGAVSGNRLTFLFNEAKIPGVYEFAVPLKGGEAGKSDSAPQEQLAYAFNVDAANEGDLRRASVDDLTSAVPGAQIHGPETDWHESLKQKKSDLSESAWIYLVFLMLLLAEQAMAVRLSFHTAAGTPENA